MFVIDIENLKNLKYHIFLKKNYSQEYKKIFSEEDLIEI